MTIRRNAGRGDSRPHETGAALVVSLVLLLVLTLLGVSSMNSSIMQELMSTAYRHQTETLSEAELLLSEAEDEIIGIVTRGAGSGTYDATGYFSIVAGDFPVGSSNNGRSLPISSWSDFPGETFGGSGSDEYVIEYIGRREIPGESVTIGEEVAGSAVSVFRITARSAGVRGSRRMVQSVFVTLQDPDNPSNPPSSDDDEIIIE